MNNEILLIIISDATIIKLFMQCIDQYFLYGNDGRNFEMEYNIKKYLLNMVSNESTKRFINDDMFFYRLYNYTKESFSKIYFFQKIVENL